MKPRHILCLVVLLVQTSIANAQSDTVKYRLLLSYLNDSTLIRYELGSLGLQKGSSLKYLSFINTSYSDMSGYFQTESFKIDSTTDSISFRRFSTFDSNMYHIAYVGDTAHGSSTMNAMVNAVRSRPSSSFFVVPDTSIFDLTSRIRYIVEVHDSSGAVVARIDTLKCFLLSGSLVYATFPTNGSIRYRSLLDLPHNKSLYITVGRSCTFKGSGSIIGDHFAMEAHNPPALYDYNIVGQSSNTSAPTDHIIPASVHTSLLHSSPISFDQIDNAVVINMDLQRPATILIRILNEAGQEVQSNTKDLGQSQSRTVISTAGLPTGAYFVQITRSREIVATGRFSVLH
jgi:hypothetical protein